MDLMKPIAISSVQEENFFPSESIFARRIIELEAILGFVLDLNQTSSQAVTRRWKYTLRQNGELKDISPLCELYTGYSQADFLNNPGLLRTIVVPEDQERFTRHLKEVVSSNVQVSLGYKIRTINGQVINVFQESLPTLPAENNPDSRTVIAQVQEINSTSKDDLHTYRRAWHYLVENNPDLIMMIDKAGKYLYSNRPLIQPGSYETIWENIKTTVVPEHRELIHSKIRSVFDSGKPTSYEIASPLPSGEIIWYMTHVGPIMEQGKVIAVILMIREITKLKRTEEALSRWNEELEGRVENRTRELQESTARHRAISELISDYVYSAHLSENGMRILDWSSGALEEITGFTMEELSLPASWDSLIHPEDRHLMAMLRENVTAMQPTVLEYRIITKTGEIRWIKDHSKPVAPVSPGEGLRLWGAVQDITDRKLAENTLQHYAQRLEASVKLNADLRQTKSRQKALEILIQSSTKALGADMSGIYLQEKNKLIFSSGSCHRHHVPLNLSNEEGQFPAQAMYNGKVTVVQVDKIIPIEKSFHSFLEKENITTLVIAPLLTSQTPIGVLYLGFHSPTVFSQSDLKLLDSFAEVGGNTLHRFLVMEQLEHNIAQREHELSILYQVMSIASETSDLDLLVNRSLELVLNSVNCPMGVLHLVDPDDHHLKLAAHKGWNTEICEKVAASNISQLIGDSFDRQKIVLATTTIPIKRGQTQQIAFLGASIVSKGMVLGRLGLYGSPDQLYDPGLTHLISSIADQLGIAVESARLRKQSEETMIIEERQRLARDLHDSVSQSLYGLVISADVSTKLLRLKEYANLKENLQSIETGALQALKEMRLMLFELRPLSLETEGLVKALNLRLNTVERRAGVEPQLTVENIQRISPIMELEMYRIITEALNNSLKHANANRVQITIRGNEEQIYLEIKDNGIGFDVEQVSNGGIGLSSMHERARRLGGDLSVQSDPKQGTRITLSAPLKASV